ncbi:hypothetical protein F4677DRAFT_320792 [Hypoxylon crocopeplum]|nr:hypothetical protein F4677DRAFT_320792 [Hypoxylon crocopeplum]
MTKYPSGRVAGPVRWHIYRDPQPPNTRMVLGSILTRPDDLEASLNYSSGIEAFPPEKREDAATMVRLTLRSELSKDVGGKLGAVLPTLPFLSAGGSLEASRSRNALATVEALNIRAQIISPDTAKEYMDRALLNPRVVEYVKGCLFAKPLYLIVGVATCSNFTGSDTRSTARSASGEVEVDAGGVQATAGVSTGRQGSVGAEYVVKGECDFAYRVREFQYSRRRKVFKKSSDVVDGAMYRLDSEDPDAETDGEVEEVPEFEYFEDEDEDIESSGVTLETPWDVED